MADFCKHLDTNTYASKNKTSRKINGLEKLRNTAVTANWNVIEFTELRWAVTGAEFQGATRFTRFTN